MCNLTVKVKYSNDYKIERIKHGDWIDLRIPEELILFTGQYRAINLGVCLQLPKGYEALVIPRSSTFKRYGLLQANSVGLIDESYCGNEDWWHFAVYATRDTFIPKGTALCQFRIIEHQPDFTIEVVKELLNENRGGFGSTGV